MFSPAASGLAAMEFLWECNKQKNYYFSITPSQDPLDEFFFCHLGGYSIPYELNVSAFSVLKGKGFLDYDNNWVNFNHIALKLEEELKKSQFMPTQKNGTLRSYRFPTKKAQQISVAGNWLKINFDFNLNWLLDKSKDPKTSRDLLMSCPGIGYKSASWILRNLGRGENIAIVDIHVFRVLKDFRIIPDSWSVERNYLEIEQSYLFACETIGAKADVMDLILWSWDRG